MIHEWSNSNQLSNHKNQYLARSKLKDLKKIHKSIIGWTFKKWRKGWYFSSYSNFSFIYRNIISANNDETSSGCHYQHPAPAKHKRGYKDIIIFYLIIVRIIITIKKTQKKNENLGRDLNSNRKCNGNQTL